MGKPITLINSTIIGYDDFGKPIVRETEKIVENVLYAPTMADDLPTREDLEGKKMVYTLAIPKGNTDNWVDCKVRFLGRTWRSFGFPIEGIDELIPLGWNKKVTVEIYE